MELDRSISPEARAARVLLLPPAFAIGILYLVRSWSPRPWTVVRVISRATGTAVRERAAAIMNHHVYSTIPWAGLWHDSYAYINASPLAVVTLAAAVLVGGIMAVILDRWVVRLRTQPTKSIP